MKTLLEIDYLVLTALARRDGPAGIRDVADEIGQDQSKVTAACLGFAEQGLVRIDEHERTEYRIGPKAPPGAALPERVIIGALAAAGEPRAIPEIAELTGLAPKEVGQSLRWLQAKGWATKQGKVLTITPAGLEAARRDDLGPDERLVAALRPPEQGPARPWVAAAALRDELGIDLDAAQKLLAGRAGMFEEKRRTLREVTLTESGRALVDGGIQLRKVVNQLTSELLVSGGWREVDLRPYDVSAAADPVFPGKEHPLVSIFQQTRRVFLEMGFEEIVSPYVESSFWDFDALFQPQDHPARDMQDTFYVARPRRCGLPDTQLVDAVRRTHEDGGETGSVGWRYRWDGELARRPVLRTHTTASTIRALAQDPTPPRKVFCVGPVFRRETVDYKHLPVFHQVDGIIIDEEASFASLLGTLSAFYRKMGFDRFQFRPAFFPYTEPSVEVFVWLEEKRDWVEMGGSGMFRPEVTLPLGCTAPVLAWGLGLERLAMFRYGLTNISELYRAKIPWLKETPLCR
jgi:phenylalanyl-tRNA synthetase alpha chain